MDRAVENAAIQSVMRRGHWRANDARNAINFWVLVRGSRASRPYI
jgi:hypothetical protein